MFDFLRRMIGRNRQGAPVRPVDPDISPVLPDDPERQFLDQLMRRAQEKYDRDHAQERALERALERAAEELLTPRERVKKRLNLPSELPVNYRADESVPVLSQIHCDDAVPQVVVVNKGRMGIKMPCVLFEYLYRQCPVAANEQQLISDFLAQWGLDPETCLRADC